MFDVDKTPETQEDKNTLLSLIYLQQEQIISIHGTIVTCFCGKRISVYYAYRCFFCGLYFCRECASRHFRIEHNCKHGKQEGL